MAEGPLVHRVSRELRRALKGKPVSVAFGVKKLKRCEPSLRRVRVEDVDPYGKQFRILLSNDMVLLVHLMMWGSWRVFRKGAEWDRPRQRARVVLSTDTHEIVAFSAPVVELLSRQELEGNSKWGDVGPDPLRPDFSRKEFLSRLGAQATREIGEVLLDQRVVSGIGNILRIEILFGAGVHPRRKVANLSRAETNAILRWTMKLMDLWLRKPSDSDGWIRVYRNSSEPCPRCGGKIDSFRQGGRITYACKTCQR